MFKNRYMQKQVSSFITSLVIVSVLESVNFQKNLLLLKLKIAYSLLNFAFIKPNSKPLVKI